MNAIDEIKRRLFEFDNLTYLDRGSAQALGVVTDVGLFLHLLAKRL